MVSENCKPLIPGEQQATREGFLELLVSEKSNAGALAPPYRALFSVFSRAPNLPKAEEGLHD